MSETTRRLRYQVAVSLDGYIAAEDGTYDWILDDDSIDFADLFAQFDTLIMGRLTFEVVERNEGQLGPDGYHGKDVYVFSRTMSDTGNPRVHVVHGDVATTLRELKAKPGKDIWLFGGGNLARQCFDAGLVDTVEVAVMPVMIGTGIPILPRGTRVSLSLTNTHTYDSGIVMLEYTVASPDLDPGVG